MSCKELCFANLQLKLLSLLFAAVLWLFVTLETGDEADMPLAVKFVNTPPGMVLQMGPAPQFSLRIAGPRTLLTRQMWRGAEAVLDLAGAKAGKVVLTGLDKRLTLIPGVRAVGVNPAGLEIILVNNKP